jgi:hypothetical protein
MATILECLQNAEFNLNNVKFLGIAVVPMVQSQLHNATALLEKGYGLDVEIEPLLETYGSVDKVPEKMTHDNRDE